MKTKVEKRLFYIIIKTILISFFIILLLFVSCQKHDEPVPVPVVKKLDESVTLQNKIELVYTATRINVKSAKLVVNKDGVLVFSEEINDVTSNGPYYLKTFKYVKDDPTLKIFTKGKYEFILTSDDFASDKLEKRTSIEIPNYKPTLNLLTLDLKQLNFMEVFNATLPIDTILYNVFADKNPEDTSILVTGVKSLDGKTIPTLMSTSTGYDVIIKAVPGSLGTYQLELEFGSTNGGLEKSILSGTIGKDTRMVINPFIYIDNPNASYNSMTTRIDRDNYILEKLLINPGNTIPYKDGIYVCTHYEYQLYFDSKKLKDKLRAPTDFGKYWLYNNYCGTNLDSIYANDGTLANMGTIEAPILCVSLTDKTHYSPGLAHAMNAVLTGRDLSTGSFFTNFANWNFIEPQADAINVQIGTYLLRRDCDEVQISYPYIVEDKINGNHWECVTLVKFRLENVVPTLTWENTDPKYNIIKQ